MSSKIRSPLRSTAAWRISIATTLAFAIGSAIAFAIMYYLIAQELRNRSDAWLVGEAEVLGQVADSTARDDLYNRIVKEVAELATREVPDERNAKGQPLKSVFFLQMSPVGKPLWVGPGEYVPFLQSIRQSNLVPGAPKSIRVPGWGLPFRVVYRAGAGDSSVYLGLSNRGSLLVLHKLSDRFVLIWCGMAVLGFLISFGGAYRTLSRVERITETVARIGTEDLGRRLSEGAGSDEIARLSRTFNHMLDRIQSSVNQLRTLTDSIAHDLKSPVTSIRGNLEVALSSEGNEDWRDQVAVAAEGLDELLQLLNTILDLAEAEGGALPLHREVVALEPFVKQLIDLYQPAFLQHGLELTQNLPDGVRVNADVPLLNRMLANLLNNELAHVPPGCRVEISIRSFGQEAEIRIADNGPGFPTELKARAFERFVKGTHSSGHGLGLAFVDAVTQAHGGRVSIGNRAGGGAVVSVYLPLTAEMN